jgi:hypothetical protein
LNLTHLNTFGLPQCLREMVPRSEYIEGAAACDFDNDSATEGGIDSGDVGLEP